MNDVSIKTEMTVGEIVAEDFRAAQVFTRHGIDFCCGGKNILFSKTGAFTVQ